MTSNLENPKSEEKPRLEKIDQKDFLSPEYKDISFAEAVLLIAKHPKTREKLLPPQLLEDLGDGKNPEDLFGGDFKDFAKRGQELKEISDSLQQVAEGLLRPELTRAFTSFLRKEYGFELNMKHFSEFKIVFMDIYRWAALFIQEGIAVPDANAVVLPSERVIVVRTENQLNAGLKESSLTQADSGKIKAGKLRLILLHEFLHACSALNYWGAEEKEGELNLITRRFGIASTRLRKRKTKDGEYTYNYLLSLKDLYEGITEKLTIAIAIDKLTSVIPIGVIEDESKKIFSGEIDVLQNLTKKIPFGYFVRAVFENGALRDLVKKADEIYGPRYLEIIGELMKWENSNKVFDYPQTIKFIQGNKIKVPFSIFKRVSPRFVTDHYPNIKLL